MAHLTEVLVKQRRFQRLLFALLIWALFLGVVIVPVERAATGASITNFFDGIWWAVTTITSVGYGDMVPVTTLGKVIGMMLQISGVLAFGLLVSLVTVSLDEAKERYYRNRLEERLDGLEEKLVRVEKQGAFVVKHEVENGTEEH